MENLAARLEIYAYEATTRLKEIEALCALAKAYGCAATSVHPCFLTSTLKNTINFNSIQKRAGINIPSGCDLTSMKVYAAKQTEIMGAQGMNVMVNMSAFLSGNQRYVKQEMDAICDSVKKPVTAVLEVGMMNETELAAITQILCKTQIAGIQTSAGITPQQDATAAVQTIRKALNRDMDITVGGMALTLDMVRQLEELGITSYSVNAQDAKQLLHELDTSLEREPLVP